MNRFVSFFVSTCFCFEYGSGRFGASLGCVGPRNGVVERVCRINVPTVVVRTLVSVLACDVGIVFMEISASTIATCNVCCGVRRFMFFTTFNVGGTVVPVVTFGCNGRSGGQMGSDVGCKLVCAMSVLYTKVVVLRVFTGRVLKVFSLARSAASLTVLTVEVVAPKFVFINTGVTCRKVFRTLNGNIRSLVLSLMQLVIIPLPLTCVFSYFSFTSSVV